MEQKTQKKVRETLHISFWTDYELFEYVQSLADRRYKGNMSQAVLKCIETARDVEQSMGSLDFTQPKWVESLLSKVRSE